MPGKLRMELLGELDIFRKAGDRASWVRSLQSALCPVRTKFFREPVSRTSFARLPSRFVSFSGSPCPECLVLGELRGELPDELEVFRKARVQSVLFSESYEAIYQASYKIFGKPVYRASCAREVTR